MINPKDEGRNLERQWQKGVQNEPYKAHIPQFWAHGLLYMFTSRDPHMRLVLAPRNILRQVSGCTS